MKRLLILGFLTVGLSFAVFLVAFVTTDRTKYSNDFVRLFPPHVADVISVFKLDTRRFSLAGLNDRVMYLRDRSRRSGLLVTDLRTTDTIWNKLDIPRESEIIVDSPYFFLQNGNMPSLQRGHTQSWIIDTTFADLPGFTAIQPISSNTAILRTIDLSKRQNLLVNSAQPNSPKYVLKKQVDGILCTDGYLQYSKEYHRLVYTYRYRNQFLVLDTSLNVQLIGKTIDTTSTARISVAKTDGKITMSKPPFVVNKTAVVNRKYLFVHSNLAAKNESRHDFNDHSVIDIYNILDGSYRFSFYIDRYNGSNMKSFRVNNLVFVALFNGAIIRYDLPANYLP